MEDGPSKFHVEKIAQAGKRIPSCQDDGALARKKSMVDRAGRCAFFQLLVQVICGFLFLRIGRKITAKGFKDDLQLLRQMRSAASWFAAAHSGEKVVTAVREREKGCFSQGELLCPKEEGGVQRERVPVRKKPANR